MSRLERSFFQEAGAPRQRAQPSGLVARTLTHRYSGWAEPVLRAIDLELLPGEIVTLLGANGSGKSTMCLLLAGVLAPSSGAVTLGGVPIEQCSQFQVQLVQQSADDNLVAPTVSEDVGYGASNRGLRGPELERRVEECLAAVGLTGFERRQVASLSGGERQRLAIAGALAVDPDFLILDEPTSAVDPITADHLLELVRSIAQAGAGVLFTTHHAAEARWADRVVVLDAGSVVESAEPRDVLYDDALLAQLGLEAPPIVQLVRELRERGVSIGGQPLTPDELWPQLCHFSS
ncbi:MAG: ATP-binding cassette domain-containing protein [Chloroflexi bacterium]|nr:ATP-binding cassette domain-containing protein [Chloroflexota bacterium]